MGPIGRIGPIERRRAILEAVIAVLSHRSYESYESYRTNRTDRTYAEPVDPAQIAVDRVADAGATGAMSRVEPWVTALRRLVDEAADLAAIRDGLPALYLAVSHRDLGAHLADAVEAADRIGVASVHQRFAEPFRDPGAMFQALGFGVAGVTKADFLSAVRAQVTRALDEGTPLREFQRTVQGLMDQHQVWGLTPARLETIYRTNTQRAFQAARYRELSAPEVTALLPYWRYVAVLDDRTRPEHRAMHGKIYPADDPIWREWYPPNGFNCRCSVVPVSQAELERRHWTVETTEPDTTPDPGWGGRGGDLETVLDRMTAAPGGIAYREVRDQPGPTDLGRPVERNLPESVWLRRTLGPSIEERMESGGLTRHEALTDIEAEYKDAMGISPKETSGLLVGPDGDGVRVDLNGLAHAMLNRTDRRERYLPLFRETIENPYEVWLSLYGPTDPAQGAPKYRRKAVGLYRTEDRGALVVTAEPTPEGWTLWNVLPARRGTIDRLRSGQVVVYGRDLAGGESQGG